MFFAGQAADAQVGIVDGAGETPVGMGDVKRDADWYRVKDQFEAGLFAGDFFLRLRALGDVAGGVDQIGVVLLFDVSHADLDGEGGAVLAPIPAGEDVGAFGF